MTLSARMQAIADMVTEGNRVCDVGCDHGYVPIYLVANKISPGVLAMDINEGPLKRAGEHILRAGLADYITLRLSDGLMKYEKGEADTLICAGMGGQLIRRILERDPSRSGDFKELILQPQSEIPAFRKFLRDEGYSIIWEDIILEDNKFYPIIKASLADKASFSVEEPEICDRFGPVLLAVRHPVLAQYLKREWENGLRLRDTLASAAGSSRAGRRMRELDEEMTYIKRAAKICGFEL